MVTVRVTGVVHRLIGCEVTLIHSGMQVSIGAYIVRLIYPNPGTWRPRYIGTCIVSSHILHAQTSGNTFVDHVRAFLKMNISDGPYLRERVI